MTTKFFEEFTIRSNGEFPMLKLNSAIYYKEERSLVVKFIISAFEVRNFDDESKNKVQKILDEMFSGVQVSVQYIRTYADNNVVKNKIHDFFNRYSQLIFRRLNDDSLKINIGEHDIEVKIIFDTPTYKILMAGNLIEKLHEYLDVNFNYEIDIQTEEIVQSAEELAGNEDIHIDTVSNTQSDGLRLVDVRAGAKVYAKGKVDEITQMPNYIVDVKGACENIVLCGKISKIDKRTYKNKRYDANNPKFGPEMLPMIKFSLDDTTAKIECVCFPSKDEDIESILALDNDKNKSADGGDVMQTVVCMGKVSWSSFSNAWSYTVNAIFEADINFDSIHLNPTKPAPEKYTTVFPQEYVDMKQKSLLDMDAKPKISPYFMGKNIVVFDLETTDLNTEIAEVIEIAALKMVDGVETETFQTLVKPTGAISETITELTSISNNMVLDAPSIEQVMPDFYKFTRDCMLVGHNIAGYDFPIVNRIGQKLGYNFDNELYDTLLLARKYLTELPNYKLENMSKHYGISHENAHRAMSDVYATAEVLKIIASRM